MKAICVTSERTLECRNIPAPEVPVPGHVLVDMVASAITHGDKFFLTRPLPGSPPADGHDVYGANGAGVVTAVGEGVSAGVLGRQVAIYKSLTQSAYVRGLWCERAQVPYASCLVLPDQVSARDFCGSLANVLTVHAFLDEIGAAGRKGVDRHRWELGDWGDHGGVVADARRGNDLRRPFGACPESAARARGSARCRIDGRRV